MKDERRTATAPASPVRSAFHRHLEIRDFDQLTPVFRGWDAEFHQLGRGRFRGEFDVVRFGSIELVRISADREIQVRGCGPRDAFGFSLITKANQAATWRGRQLRPGQVNLNKPGGPIDHLSSIGYENLLIRVDAASLQNEAELLYGVDLTERLASIDAFATGAAEFSGLEAFLRRVLAAPALGSWPSPAEGFGEQCLRRVLGAFASADPILRAPVHNQDRRALVRRMEEFMRASLSAPLSVKDLCREAGVSERTLRYSFREVYGLSPMAFFKTLKLHGVRSELKKGRVTAATVGEIARQWGFEHAGNFAADYRRLFGERPSETHGRTMAVSWADQKS